MIGGNVTVKLQQSSTSKNTIGESVKAWVDVKELTGWLDLQGGNSNYTTYNAKIQESTHIFICDYVSLGNVKAENCRIVANGEAYDVMLIDDPMEMHKQLEIYLKYTGGQ